MISNFPTLERQQLVNFTPKVVQKRHMNKQYLDLLINPKNGEPFIFNENKEKIICKTSGDEFEAKSGIPIIKEIKEQEGLGSTKLHKNHSSTFQYLSHYEKDAELFDYFEEPACKATEHEELRLHETIFSSIKNNNTFLLDVGCGNGWASLMGNKKGLKVISMDISSRNPTQALKNNNNPNHYGLVADVYNLPIKEKSLEYIIASEIMEHVINPTKFVDILYGKLKNGGKLIITTPYNEKLNYSLCVHCNSMTPNHAHIHSFSENNITKLIPPGCQWKWKKFSNKLLAKLRTHIILQFVPYRLWCLIDKIANKIANKPTRLLIEIKKPAVN